MGSRHGVIGVCMVGMWITMSLRMIGCAGTIEPPPMVNPGVLEMGAPGFSSEQMEMLQASSARFRVEQGEGEGEVVVREIVAGDDDATTLREFIEDHELISEQFVRQDTDGSLLMHTMHNTRRGRITTFEPPLVLMPAHLPTDEVYEQSVRVFVADLDDPEQINERGTGESVIRYRGIQRIQTPAGAFDAHLVRSELTTDFGPAKAQRITDRWYAPDLGLVAESYEERIQVMGLTVERKQRSMRRLDPH